MSEMQNREDAYAAVVRQCQHNIKLCIVVYLLVLIDVMFQILLEISLNKV